ncbi:MAG: enoyl-CoA hydratase/isomerase family protein [Gemmatimonadota bacterium]
MIDIQSADGIARITLCAPPLNILNRALLREFREALNNLRNEASLRVLLIDAEGKNFSAGASVNEHLPPECDEMLADFAATVLALYEFPVPVMAVVQGRCLGGAFELVQAADLIVAAEDAQFGQPEILLGVFAPVACALLPARIGPARAAELLFTGDPISARHASEAGLVASVVGRSELAAESLALAQRIARHSATTLRMTKRALRVAADRSPRHGITAATHLYTKELMASHDALEGLQAFGQKRVPQWSNQ